MLLEKRQCPFEEQQDQVENAGHQLLGIDKNLAKKGRLLGIITKVIVTSYCCTVAIQRVL
jgi:hypothetical protein